MVMGVIAAVAVQQTTVGASAAVCDGLLARATAAKSRRPIKIDDLVRLRDIGPTEPSTGYPTSYAASPDRRRIAFVLRRADPIANRYCVALVTIAADGSGRPAVLDTGDDLIRVPNLNRGMNNGLMGVPALITPHWSPDGQWIAYLKNVAGVPQVWRVRIDGQHGEAATSLPEGVDDFAWTSDGRGLVVAHQPGKIAAAAAIDDEGKSGYLYDKRTWAIAFTRPSPPAAISTEFATVMLDTGAVRDGTADERARLLPLPVGVPVTAARGAVSADRRRVAYVESLGPAFGSATRMRVFIEGREIPCRWAACGSLNAGLWWSASGALTWLRTEDDAVRGQMALYRWTPSRGAPRRLFLTDDLIRGCEPTAEDRVACSQEGSLQPKRVVDVDLKTGKLRTLFDPNPNFANLKLGAATRLTWADRYGIRDFGDLVLPPDHRAGQRHPLIVVQYDSRGFLRGGTSDEYPVQLLAAHGFAVLSINKSSSASGLRPQPDLATYQHVAIPNSTYRTRTLGILEQGVATAIGTGSVDETRMGITGLSDGALTACFALMHSQLFTAASLSSGCEEPVTSFAAVGPAYYDDLVNWHYPFPDRDPAGFWNDNALSRNLHALATPILVQSSDDELRLALETFAKAEEYHLPFELVSFPGEHHTKWQPTHRAAIYQRNLDWFDFWLRGVERPDPVAMEQYQRWHALRAQRDAASAMIRPTPPRPPAPGGAVAPQAAAS